MTQELQRYKSDDELEKLYDEIWRRVTEQFWKESLSPVENKYRIILDRKLDFEHNRLINEVILPRNLIITVVNKLEMFK